MLRAMYMASVAAAAAALPYLNNPCIDPSSPQSKLPWCDATLPVDVRVDDMISRMNVTEKIATLDTTAPGIPSLGLVPYNWWSEATHGISRVRNDATTPVETNFALPITTGMSFNRTLWKATGTQIGREARALMNVGNAWSTYWAPVVNLAREPRWGRNIETPGEDPFMSGEYAAAFVQGFQTSEDDPRYLQASACCKHYAVNSMEHSTVAGVTWTRHNFDANVTQQDLVDSYLLPFQACVEKGKVSGLMCSYNAINGIPSCANDWLLQTVARDSWNFDGYITSDCDADNDVFASHHYTATPEEAVAAVLRAGTDVDCEHFVGQHAQSALDKGVITEADIDARLRKLFRVRMRLQHFDPEGPLQKIPTSDVCSDDAKELARDGVRQSMTLLKNDAGTLPLDAAALGTVAVIGPNANLSWAIAGYYGPLKVCDGKFWNMVDAVEQYAQKTVTALGVPDVKSSDTSGVAAAAALAASADAVILVLGTDMTWAREEYDATNITFSDGQLALVAAVAAAADKPVTVVILSAVPLDISPLLSNAQVGAVLHAGQVSVQTFGVADVVFGARSPAGRAVQTQYPKAYQDMVSIFDFNMRPGPSAWPRPDCAEALWGTGQCPLGTNPGRTYRFYTGAPVVPFGYGLSYTTFEYAVSGPATVAKAAVDRVIAASADVLLQRGVPLTGYVVNVTNTGAVDSDNVVLGFITPPNAGQNGAPLKSLFGFERVHVKAGATVSVYLYPEAADFALADAAGRFAAAAGEYTVHFGVEEAATSGYAAHKVTLQ
eukprot:TRINITY_DN25_c1_g1_i1.p1 TRINITY_DN25_c1_g1~~TRINITY_DN25_c1_g1_i1.p1  ORF type:complete len:777 (+),score=300.19 TRINITY_DN25_c1_g1_i1:50-2380(+)